MARLVPRVSVMIAAYNAEAFIAKAIASVQAQTERNIEIIVVDDGSTDHTADVAEAMAAGDTRITVIRQGENRGVSAARNAALDAARGDWVAILDSDDEFVPSRLQILLDYAGIHAADMVADNLDMHDFKTGEPLGLAFPDAWMRTGKDVELGYLLERDIPGIYDREIGFLKPLIRREILVKNNIRYDEEIYAAEDFLLYAECILNGAKFRLMPEALYLYALRRGSLSSKRQSNESGKKVSEILLRRMARGAEQEKELLRLRLDATNYELFIWHIKRGRVFSALRPMFDMPIGFTFARLQAVILGRLGFAFHHPTLRHLDMIRRRFSRLQAG